MGKHKVGFIKPTGEIVYMEYGEVLTYCMSICCNMDNIDQYFEFSINYSYFNAYFDFVLSRLNYIFLNPLFIRGKCLVFVEDAYYLCDFSQLSYNEIISRANEEVLHGVNFMTKCSNSSLDICKASLKSERSLIDPNMYSLMSVDGCLGGSHSVTANTMLNQLLIKSILIRNDYSTYLVDNAIDDYNDALNYLVSRVGVMRFSNNPNLSICNEYNTELQPFIAHIRESGGHVYSIDKKVNSLSLEYKKSVGLL